MYSSFLLFFSLLSLCICHNNDNNSHSSHFLYTRTLLGPTTPTFPWWVLLYLIISELHVMSITYYNHRTCLGSSQPSRQIGIQAYSEAEETNLLIIRTRGFVLLLGFVDPRLACGLLKGSKYHMPIAVSSPCLLRQYACSCACGMAKLILAC